MPLTCLTWPGALNMPKSSALLMLRVLVDRGYLQKGGDGSYSLVHLPGYHSIQAGRHGALKVFATPILEEAVHSAGETGILAAVDGHNIRFLRKCLPGQQIVCDPAIGATPRLNQDACGIAILMASEPAVIARYIEAARLTACEAHALKASVSDARKDGYVLQNSREIDGVACVAVAVPNATGTPFAAIKLAGPTGRLVANLDRVSDAAIHAAARVGELVARCRVGSSREDDAHAAWRADARTRR